MKKPNFFIIGAPKCGTTSICRWLQGHPNVFIPEIKEPHYFSTDLPGRRISTLDRYERLFSSVPDKVTAVGEGSTNYIYSRVALKNILAYNEDAKFIICLRNPLELVVSLHEEYVYHLVEEETDFKKAWDSQKFLKVHDVGSVFCETGPPIYKHAGMLGLHVERAIKAVGREKILFVTIDGLKINPRKEYLRLLEFLNVPDDGKMDFEVFNQAKTNRFRMLRQVGLIAGKLKIMMRIDRNFGLLKPISRFNSRKSKRVPIEASLHKELMHVFRDDIYKLSSLIGKDLSRWVELHGLFGRPGDGSK